MTNSDKPLDALVFAPHPDDAEIGMGGTIAKMIAAGLRVGVVDMTRGEWGTKGTVEIRAEEIRSATTILGLHYRVNMDLGDGRIWDNDENRIKVVELIRKMKCPAIFVTSSFDRHPDHLAAAELVGNAFFYVRLPKFETESPPFSPRRCFHYLVHDLSHVTFAVNITDFFAKKIEALQAYCSQFVDPVLPSDYHYIGMSDYLAQIEAGNRTIGTQIGAKYAEGFYVRSLIAVPLPTWIE